MKITLIEPRSPDYHIYSGVVIPRLGLPLLGTILRERGHEVKVYNESLADITPQAAWDIFKSDIAGISVTTSTAPRGYAMARLLRLKEIPVVFGGSHVTFMPEEAIKYGNYVLTGEAEESLPMLLDAIAADGDLSQVPNLVYRDGDRVVHTAKKPLSCPLDELPVPDIGLIEGHEELKILPAMTTRGCPHRCTFCSVSDMFGPKYRMTGLDRLMEEARQWKGRKVFFCDDNFTAIPSRTKQLLDGMLRTGRTPRRWYAQVRADAWQDRELMELMKRTNCARVYVGYESVNQKVLDDYNKRQTVADIKASIAGFHSYGIPVHGMFMFGDDYEGKDTFSRTCGFAADNQIDTVQFLVLTPVPGTELFRRMDGAGRIITYDWSLYDGHHVVFEPAQMTPLELQLGMVRASRQFYSARSALRSLFSFRFSTAMLRYWGKRVLHGWHGANKGFMNRLRSEPEGGGGLPGSFSLKKAVKRDPFEVVEGGGHDADAGAMEK